MNTLRSNPNVFYISYVGKHMSTEVGHLFKYGISSNMPKRIEAHKRTFDKFELGYMRSTTMKEHVERDFESEVKTRGLHRIIPFNGKRQTELVLLDSRQELQVLVELADHIIDNYDLMDVNNLEKMRLHYKLKLLKYKMSTNYKLEMLYKLRALQSN